jgi:hypothetical protein
MAPLAATGPVSRRRGVPCSIGRVPSTIARAVWRDRVIHPAQYADEEQAQNSAASAAMPERTKRRWRHACRMAEERYGSGFLGLLPRFTDRGGTRKAGTDDVGAHPRAAHEPLRDHGAGAAARV